MPETHSVTVEDLEGVADWARDNVSPADQARIHSVIETHARDMQHQFANQPTLWEIDWLYRDDVKEFYRLALVNTQTLRELWGYS